VAADTLWEDMTDAELETLQTFQLLRARARVRAEVMSVEAQLAARRERADSPHGTRRPWQVLADLLRVLEGYEFTGLGRGTVRTLLAEARAAVPDAAPTGESDPAADLAGAVTASHFLVVKAGCSEQMRLALDRPHAPVESLEPLVVGLLGTGRVLESYPTDRGDVLEFESRIRSTGRRCRLTVVLGCWRTGRPKLAPDGKKHLAFAEEFELLPPDGIDSPPPDPTP
jgi:hypothetical protein